MSEQPWARRAALLAVICFCTVSVNPLQFHLPPLEKIFPHGALVIGVDASTPPFAVATADDLYGLEIDLGREIGRRIGMPVRFVNMGYDGLYDSLLAGQVDAVFASLWVDPSRLADVRYTWAYFNAGLLLVSEADDPVTAMDALPGRRLAYEFGSAADTEARAWSRRVASFARLPYELPAHALDAVRLGEADAALVDAVAGRLYLRAHPDWAAHTVSVSFAPISAAVDIDRRAVLHLLNAAILEMLNDGSMDALLAEWL